MERPNIASKEPGFYWAKWLIAEAETRQALDLPFDQWEVVWVFQNGSDLRDKEYFRVLIVGVESSQSIKNFEWRPGPLLPPP